MSSFRITTNGVLRNYRSNLFKSYGKLNDAMIRVQTHRQFNSFAEDPAAASRAFQLRRSIWRTDDQITNNQHLVSTYETAFNAMESIIDADPDSSDDNSLSGIKEALAGITGTAGAGRVSLGQVLMSKADGIIQLMNTQYSGNYVFAGADGLNVPFSWGEDGALLYRGMDVSASAPGPEPKQEDYQKYVTPVTLSAAAYSNGTTPLLEGGKPVYSANGEPLYSDGTDEVTQAFLASDDVDAYTAAKAAYDSSAENYESIRQIANEAVYVDIGLGLEEEDGQLVTSSAFNGVLSGLNILGYGTDADGDSKNMAVIMKELGSILNRCDPKSGEYADSGDAEKAEQLYGKLRDAIDRVSEQHAKLTADASYLNTNLKQLQDTRANLEEQRATIEELDPADAITEMMWGQYCYNAALKIGNNILSQSLIDYMQ